MAPTQGSTTRPRALAPELAALLLAAFALRLGVWFLAPNIIYPDAIFQVMEPAHRLAFGTGLMSWEWTVGIRSWLLPGLFAALMWIGDLFGDAPWMVNLPVAVALAASSSVTAFCAYGWGTRAAGRAGGFVSAAFCVVWVDLVYMSGQALTEVVAGHCLVAGLYLGYRGEDAEPAPPRRLFWAGLLLGLAFAFRFHLGPALALAAFGICGMRRGRTPWRHFAAGAAGPVLALGLLDWATLGLPFQSVWLNFWLNAVEGVSEGAGTSPFATLLLTPVHIWGLPGFLLVAAAVALGARRLPLLLIVALAVFLTHSLFAHKEYRFIYPALPLLAVLAGVGTARLVGLALARWPGMKRRSALLAGGAALAWGGLSLSIATSDVFSIPWTRSRSQLLAFEDIARDPSTCGVALYDMIWIQSAGNTWLRPRTRLYTTDAERLPAEAAAYNTIMAEGGTAVPDPAYRRQACFAGTRDHAGHVFRHDCVWRRPGGCDARAAPEPGPIWDHFEAARRYAPAEEGGTR